MFQENLRIFIKDFGSKLVFTLESGVVIDKNAEGNDLLGIYDDSYASPEMGYMLVQASRPRLTCVEADVLKAIINRGASVSVEEKGTFKVYSNLPDGTGISTIELTKQ